MFRDTQEKQVCQPSTTTGWGHFTKSFFAKNYTTMPFLQNNTPHWRVDGGQGALFTKRLLLIIKDFLLQIE